jgi:CO/xanthine dehydrogenase Mo-binding subunit
MVKCKTQSVHDYRHIGKPTLRADGKEIVQGKAVFLDDVPRPDALTGKVKGSPYAHARILRIDISKALQVPGVAAILTHKDLDPSIMFGLPPHKPVLDRTMTFVGDAAAIIAADTQEHANMASDLIEVDYEVLEPVLDAVEAQKDDAPQIYPDYLDHNIVPGGMPVFQPNGLWWHLEKGDVEKGFQECAYVADGVVRFNKKPVPLAPETPGVIVKWEGGDLYRTWATSQSIMVHQMAVCRIIPGSQIEAMAYNVGGSYGNKTVMKTITAYGMLLSRVTNRPVKFIQSKIEQNTMYETRLGSTFEGKIGMDKDAMTATGLRKTAAAYHAAFTGTRRCFPYFTAETTGGRG